jgi:excisionase family DNA binding protein
MAIAYPSDKPGYNLLMLDTTGRRRFLTVKEAAATLRLSENTVYRLTRSGVIESVRVGGSVRIPARALDPESKEEK